MTYDFSILATYHTALLRGLLNTLQLTGISIVLGCVLGFLVALARTSNSRILRSVSTVYVSFLRGTPLLIQLFWIFFCLPLLLGVEISNFLSGVIALTLYMGAVSSETFRASFNFVGAEQHQACDALGLPYSVRMLHVVLPQSILRAVPTLLSNCTSLFKESALVSAVGMADLMQISQVVSNRTGHPVEVLTAAALIYFVIAFPITRAVAVIERKVLTHLAI